MNIAVRPVLLLAALALLLSAESPAKSLDLEQHRGKVVLVDFWASWCAPCRTSLPWLNAMQAKYADRGLVVIGVNVDQDRALADAFLREVPVRFPIIYDPDGALAGEYDLPGMPSSFIFDAAGKLVTRHIGFRESTRDEREAEIVQLLAKSRDATNRP